MTVRPRYGYELPDGRVVPVARDESHLQFEFPCGSIVVGRRQPLPYTQPIVLISYEGDLHEVDPKGSR